MKQRKSNRTIESILDLKTGNEIISSDFFEKSIEDIFKYRYEFESDIREKRKRFVCYFCKQNIKIRGKINSKTILHFAHLKDSDDCLIKTDNKYSKSEIEKIKYNGAKESDLHFMLKNLIASSLNRNENTKGEVEDVKVEHVKKDKAIPKIWKKPDVSAKFKKLEIVFELQLSTTFLSVINDRQEFYKKNKTFILWVFSHFESKNDRRKFTQSDIFYSNNRNGFEFDKKAQELSKSENDLILNCHFEEPTHVGRKLKFKWKSEYVRLSELTFNETTFKVFYFDVERKQKEIEKLIELEKSDFLRIIKQGDLPELFERFQYYNLSEIEYKTVKDLYNKKISQKEIIESDSVELSIIWALIAFKLKQNNIFSRTIKNHKLKKILLVLLSLKTNKIIEYNFKRQIQIAHNILDRQPEYMSYYEKGIKLWGNIGNDKDNKLKKKISDIKTKGIEQEENVRAIELIFPELK